MTTMKHKKIIPMLEDYVLERLTATQAQTVKSHLDDCEDCRRKAEELKMFGDEIYDYCESQAEAPVMLWRERLRKGQLPPQPVKQDPEDRPDSILRRLQQLLLPRVARPVPLLVSFLMGLLALPVAQRMGAWVPLIPSGTPVVSASQVVAIKAERRSAQASRLPVYPDIESITFQMSVEDLMEPRRYRCQLYYQERIVADKVVPAIDGSISFSVQVAILEAGQYRLEWFEDPLQQGGKRDSSFELLKVGATRSPPQEEKIR